MTTKRYVLFKPTRVGEIAQEDISGISSLANIVDSIGSRAFLVDATEERIAALRQRLADWSIQEERAGTLPDADG